MEMIPVCPSGSQVKKHTWTRSTWYYDKNSPSFWQRQNSCTRSELCGRSHFSACLSDTSLVSVPPSAASVHHVQISFWPVSTLMDILTNFQVLL
ncbi:Multidrug Resistance-Associated Protein 9 [Manis pentadactyla]|nr:Multidrug Resistance-Associated Protein 9 [Manis pentadactyla]